ncbi:Protein of unknown function [Tenacibaculum sp. MAR_2009_124]|uniref:DUF2452 domain-containing protein n=1 Tax=Tenacibaculum sp. MAR_2009_124 TaxID=1250059 RepID=UPI00089D0DAB|nr:DUF2452 domain-containing protein [Tenacibaculum sp. MAR_2009_124]SEB44272.1 Protein of unknown function [Tenacibaculum sp. MAR_2009_124]
MKKPDSVVYNEETNEYDAYLKPYGTSLTAPKIDLPNSVSWKKQNITLANKQIKASFDELKKEFESLYHKFAHNELVYSAKFTFEPIVGETYHLYKNEKGNFLSLLKPSECSFNYLGSFRLDSDKIWNKIE